VVHRLIYPYFSFMSVYSVVLDLSRKQVYSGSMDTTVRIWNLVTGQCQHTLTGHDSLVGLIALSPTFLVSAGADGKSCVWDPDTGELRQTFAAHTGAVTCFMHDDIKVLSGANGDLKLWNIRDGTVIRDLLTEISGVWQVVFEGRWCVAAVDRSGTLMLDVWDFANEPDNGMPSELPEDGTVTIADSEDEDDPKHKGLKTSMKNELGLNSHDSLVIRDDSKQSDADEAVGNQGVQGVDESIETSQEVSHAVDVGGTSVVPSDLANATHANEPETR
jgi:F-box and WD-40 domain protein CDC4